MKKKISAVVSAAVLTWLMTAPAQAENQRPCVTKAEFYGARDFGIPLVPGHDNLSKVPYAPTTIGRLVLEEKWDVRHRGVSVSRTVDGVGIGLGPLAKVKMYKVCGVPLSELQIYVGYHRDTNLVFWMLLWRTS